MRIRTTATLVPAAVLVACAYGRYVPPPPLAPTQTVIHARFGPAWQDATAWFAQTHFPIQQSDSATGTLATRAYLLTSADSAQWINCGKEAPGFGTPPHLRVFAAAHVTIKNLGDSVAVGASVELTIDYPPGYAPEDKGYSSQTVVCYSTGKWEAGLVGFMQRARID
jgi:hypothetical protein